MKLGLISSAWQGTEVGTAKGIKLTKEIGFDTIDIFTDPLDIDIKEKKLIRDTCVEVGIPVVSMPCVAVGLIDFNFSIQRFHVERCKKFLDLVYELEAKNLLLVLGEYIWQQEVIAPGDQRRWGVENLRKLGEYAASLGLEIAIELEPFEQAMINTVDKMANFLSDVSHPVIKANVDISHLHLAGTPPEDLQKLKDRVAHVHISDCDGKIHGDLPPGRGVVDFESYLKALDEIGFDGVVSIELEYSPEPKKIVEWVREAYIETNRIMQKLGIRK